MKSVTLAIIAMVLVVSLITLSKPTQTGFVTAFCPELTCPQGMQARAITLGQPTKDCVCGNFISMGNNKVFIYENRDIVKISTR